MLNGSTIPKLMGGIYSLCRMFEDYPDQFHLQVVGTLWDSIQYGLV